MGLGQKGKKRGDTADFDFPAPFVPCRILKTQTTGKGEDQLLVLSRKFPWPFYFKAWLKCWCF